MFRREKEDACPSYFSPNACTVLTPCGNSGTLERSIISGGSRHARASSQGFEAPQNRPGRRHVLPQHAGACVDLIAGEVQRREGVDADRLGNNALLVWERRVFPQRGQRRAFRKRRNHIFFVLLIPFFRYPLYTTSAHNLKILTTADGTRGSYSKARFAGGVPRYIAH